MRQWYFDSLRQRRNRFSRLSCSSFDRFFIGETASLEREPEEADADVGLAEVIIRGPVSDSDG